MCLLLPKPPPSSLVLAYSPANPFRDPSLSPACRPVMAENDVDNELLDYEDDEVETAAGGDGTEAPAKKDVKGSYVSIHSSGFRDFLLKPELLRAIVDCGFEHPSEGKSPLGHRALVRCRKGPRNTCLWSLSGPGLGWGRLGDAEVLEGPGTVWSVVEESGVGGGVTYNGV